jgi:hypothetical protein
MTMCEYLDEKKRKARQNYLKKQSLWNRIVYSYWQWRYDRQKVAASGRELGFPVSRKRV